MRSFTDENAHGKKYLKLVRIPEGYLGKIGDGYVRAIRVPFSIPQKSLKGLEIFDFRDFGTLSEINL